MADSCQLRARGMFRMRGRPETHPSPKAPGGDKIQISFKFPGRANYTNANLLYRLIGANSPIDLRRVGKVLVFMNDLQMWQNALSARIQLRHGDQNGVCRSAPNIPPKTRSYSLAPALPPSRRL